MCTFHAAAHSVFSAILRCTHIKLLYIYINGIASLLSLIKNIDILYIIYIPPSPNVHRTLCFCERSFEELTNWSFAIIRDPVGSGTASRFAITPHRHYPLQQMGTSPIGVMPPAKWDGFQKKNILTQRNSPTVHSPVTVKIARPDPTRSSLWVTSNYVEWIKCTSITNAFV